MTETVRARSRTGREVVQGSGGQGAMLKVCVAGFAAGLLTGCGLQSEEPNPTPAQPGYRPASLEEAWNNHQSSLKRREVSNILRDYDEGSIIRMYNTATMNGQADLEEHQGLEQIQKFFEGLFSSIGEYEANFDKFFKFGSIVYEQGETLGAHQVLHIWNKDENDKRATSTLIYDNNFKIRRQNLVMNWPGMNPSSKRRLALKKVELMQEQTPVEHLWTNEVKASRLAHSTIQWSKLLEGLNTEPESPTLQLYDCDSDGSYLSFSGFFQVIRWLPQYFFHEPRQIEPIVLVTDDEADVRQIFLVWQPPGQGVSTETIIINENDKLPWHNAVFNLTSPSTQMMV